MDVSQHKHVRGGKEDTLRLIFFTVIGTGEDANCTSVSASVFKMVVGKITFFIMGF